MSTKKRVGINGREAGGGGGDGERGCPASPFVVVILLAVGKEGVRAHRGTDLLLIQSEETSVPRRVTSAFTSLVLPSEMIY